MKNQEVLKAYATQILKEDGYLVDQELLDFISNHIQLSEGEPNEKDQERSIDIHEDTDGTITAKQFNWYNLISIKNYDLAGVGIDTIPLLLLSPYKGVAFTYLALKLIHKLSGNLFYEFNEQDAKVLYAIYCLGDKAFTVADVEVALEEKLKEEISDERLARSITFFRKRAIIKHQGDGVYKLIESVEYERDY